MNTTAGRSLSPEARSLIADPAVLIDGRWEPGAGAPIVAIDPASELEIGQAGSADAHQVADAIDGARRCFDSGAWSRLRPRDRALVLRRAVDALSRHRDALVEVIVAETGTPITLARMLQVDAMIEHFAWFADAAARGPAGGFEQGMAPHAGPPASASALVREPVGVVAALTPYNIPLMTAVWKAGAALAAGCTAILAPSPRAFLTSLAWTRIVAEADLPPGALSLLAGEADLGRQLTESPDVDLVTFTGSNAVGRQVMRQAASTFKRVVLELGGKSPNVLLPGADVEAAVAPSILRFCRNAGQACGATTRTFVPRADYERYLQGAQSFMASVAVGDPFDERTVVGPLIRSEHRARVQGYVERALADGGRVEAGGLPTAQARGFYMSPLLIGGVGNDAEISQEELFGPVGVVIPYDDVEQAIAMANDSRYGLNANVWGASVADALALARRIRSGTVTVNGGGALRADAPFGGYRESGIGREAGEEGFSAFFEVKHLQWPLD